MSKNNYPKSKTVKAICEKLDTLSFGFPRSWLKNDYGLIKRIFDEESGQTFIKMKAGFQTAKEYAEANNISEDEASKNLENAANKALIFRKWNDHEKKDYRLYAPYPFVAGLLEFQVQHSENMMWLLHVSLYMLTSKFGKRMSQTMPFYRTLPRHPEEVEGGIVAPYDNIKEIMDRHTRFSVAPCICRIMYRLKPNNTCNHPIETCIETDEYADFFNETGIGRPITKEEAWKIIMDGEKDGRVVNVTNSKDGENICSCCACGCGMLYLKTHYRGPGGNYWNNYYANWHEDKCVHCGQCYEACGFKYLKHNKKTNRIEIDKNNCLGCGICASKCKTGALKLIKKKDSELYEPPQTYDDAIEVWTKNTKKN